MSLLLSIAYKMSYKNKMPAVNVYLQKLFSMWWLWFQVPERMYSLTGVTLLFPVTTDAMMFSLQYRLKGLIKKV